MKIKTVAVPQVMQWYQFGYQLWLRDKWQWLLISLFCVLLMVGVAITPYIHWLMYLVLPLWLACLMYMARRAVQGKEPALEHLGFILGLEEQRTQLLLMGLGLAVVMLVVSLLGQALEPRTVLNYSLDELAQASKGLAVGGSLVGTVLSSIMKTLTVLVAIVVLLFAPALTLFRKMPAPLAVKTSLKAFWRNKGALAFFLFLQCMFTLLALLPLGLGLLVLLPISVIALYRAYTEIFISSKLNQ